MRSIWLSLLLKSQTWLKLHLMVQLFRNQLRDQPTQTELRYSCERNFNHLINTKKRREYTRVCMKILEPQIKCSREFIICDRAVKNIFLHCTVENLFKFLKTWIYLSEMWWQGKLAKRLQEPNCLPATISLTEMN